MRKYLFLIAFVCTLLIGCKPDPVSPTVSTFQVQEITGTTALCSGCVTDNGNATIIAKGFCWSTTQNPTLENDFTIKADSKRNEPAYLPFTATITGLNPNTTYYIRAYATNEVGTSYGDEHSFKTMDLDDFSNGHEFVDLGLPSGLKWATCNVGATAPDEYGEYYAWGEIEPKDYYGLQTYLYYNVDLSDFSGDPQYDVASAKWGADWRMPTRAEYEELLEYCTLEQATLNNVSGYKVTGQNGNHIFFPGAGTICGSDTNFEGDGYYLTSTPELEEWDGYYMCSMCFSGTLFRILYYEKSYGNTIRPVTE